jgi:FLVCR family MFS transporter 7
MAQYIGFAVPMLLAPMIAEKSGIRATFFVFTAISIVSAAIAILFTREKPAIAPPGPAAPKEDLSARSITKLFANKAFLLVLFICLISIGIFNTILTLIETILLPRGITSAQAGVIGSVFVLTGIIGAVVLPIISDNLHKRVIFFIGNVTLLIPLYLGFTFVTNFPLLAVLAGLAGFLTMGVAPILFQHGTEIAYPIQEGTSLGVILLMGQISGALFVYLFDVLQNVSKSVTVPMLFIVALTAIELPATLKMKESKINVS